MKDSQKLEKCYMKPVEVLVQPYFSCVHLKWLNPVLQVV